MRKPAVTWFGFTANSLAAQARARLFLVILIASIALLTLGTLSFETARNSEIRQRKHQVEEYYANLLPRIENSWQSSALQTVNRLEFSRILEDNTAARWPKLTAYMNAQWALNEFGNLVILDADHQAIFKYGSEAGALMAVAGQTGSWLFLPEYRQVYRAFKLPLWLGQGGQGEIVLFKAINHSLMQSLLVPQTQLAFRLGDATAIESSDKVNESTMDPTKYLRVEIPWPVIEQGRPASLLAYRDLQDLPPFSGHVVRPIFAIAIILSLIWFGLGRWLGEVTQRIAMLGVSARKYAAGYDHASLQQDLDAARMPRDEIGQTAVAISDMLATIEARNEEQRGFMETLSLLEEAVISVSAGGLIEHASPGWDRLTDQPDSIGQSLYQYICDKDTEMVQGQIQQLFAGEKDSVTLRIRLKERTQDDQEFWVEARFIAHKDTERTVLNVRGVLRDITQHYLHEKQITQMALHDALTDLPNRILLEDRFKVALRLASRNHEFVGVCFIDLDHFKVVNDSLGHKAGDRLLVAFSKRLRDCLRSGDTLARWGGDEFVMLLPEMESENTVRQVTEKIISSLQDPIQIDNNEIRVTFSMGAAVYPADGTEIETLFSHADRAMFYAKSQGRNQVCFFQDMTKKGLGKKEIYIQNRLASAIQDGVLQPWFQPIVDAQTGRCTAVEVLARWHDPQYGWISPATFIPMAENLGLIRELGHQIMEHSLDALRDWHDTGHRIYMAVNVSKRQLFIHSFTSQLLESVARRNLNPNYVVLEVTESVAINDVEHGADRIDELQAAGFPIAIDDFGTGYSSLSQLHEFKAVELKVDMSFVRRLHEPSGRTMVQAIVNMAHALGMKTVAEGVEDEETARVLADIGVSCLQGYLFGKPMTREEFGHWLSANVEHYNQLGCSQPDFVLPVVPVA